MKKIMILSSTYTGHGHASIAQAITEQLDGFEDVRYEVIDGFGLIGKAAVQMSKIYGPVTRKARELYKVGYALFDQHPRALIEGLTVVIHDKFMKRLSRFMPDLILVVHPFFNGSVINILEYYNLDIPVYALQCDLININAGWCDPRATLTLCPTQEAYDCSIQRGMPPDKMVVCGFPTRARFTEAARARSAPVYDGLRTLNCLLMSGGEGSGNLLKYAKYLLKYVDCSLTIICGRNHKLKDELEQALGGYADRLNIYGFLDNVHEHMQKSDLVIARGSPNTLMEAVVLGVPLLITGALPGQEADNPAVMVSHNLAVMCESPESVPAIVHTLTMNGGKRLKEIQAAQHTYRNLDHAKNIAAMIHDAAVSTDRAAPRKRIILLPGQERRAARRGLRKNWSQEEA